MSAKKKKSHPTILFRTSMHNTVLDVMESRPGWRETDSDTDWDVNWSDIGWVREYFDHTHMDDHQRINHFRNHYELTRKDLLVKNLKRMRKQLQRSNSHEEAAKYDFWCPSFVVPAEYGLFLEEFKRTPGAVWIMKPVGKAQGRGIFLFNKLHQISDWKKDHKWKSDAPQAETYIAQRYIENPYLVGGKKFDLRLYVLVTSFSPLVVWLYRSGFARFSNTRYSVKKGDIHNLYMHLTNASVQKKADDYDKEQGCKWDLRSLKLLMIARHGTRAVDECFYDIQCAITRSLLSVQQVIIQDKHCFELYGYDILIDEELKPWLVEVNASPSLTGDVPADYDLKKCLISDTLDIIDAEGSNVAEESDQMGGYDHIWHNGPVRADRHSAYSCCLGAHNPRLSRNPQKPSRGGAGRT